MTLRPKTQKQKLRLTTQLNPSSISKPKQYLKTQSTYLHSNNSSCTKIQNQKAAKAVYKMQKNLSDLKKACNIPPKPEPTVSNKQMMAVTELQNYYTLINGKSTDNIEILYKFYKQHFIPNGSSSSSNGSESCIKSKRKTVQDIRMSQPCSPSRGNGEIVKSRRGSQVSKGIKKESKEKSRIKTQISNKNLVLKTLKREESNKKEKGLKEELNESKEKSGSKKMLKSILKKPSFENLPTVNKGVRGSIPVLFSKLYQNKPKEKSSNSKSKQASRSPRHKETRYNNKMLLTTKTLQQDSSKSSLVKSERSKKDLSKFKLLNKKKQSLKLTELLDDINQLSPISHQPYNSIKTGFKK